MPRLDNAIEIKAPREKVFAYISDVATHPEWVKWTKDAAVTSEVHTGVGTTTTSLMQVGPRKERVEAVVMEYKQNEVFTQRHTRGMEMTDCAAKNVVLRGRQPACFSFGRVRILTQSLDQQQLRHS